MLYMEDNRTTYRATVTKVGTIEINKKLYHSVQLNETIFHPKGGGQLPDEGTIDSIKVAYVHKDQLEIYHCFNEPTPFQIGDEVDLVVNADVRHLHSRLHTAGHLLAEAVNKCYPELEAYQGNHYPENSYVRFKILSPLQNEFDKQAVEKHLNTWIEQDSKVESRLEQGIRRVKVYQNWSLCGGTHVSSLKEIEQMEISNISFNKKEGIVSVKYFI